MEAHEDRSNPRSPRRLPARTDRPAEPRRPYVAPRLELAGEVAAMTLGSAGFNAESGGTFFEL